MTLAVLVAAAFVMEIVDSSLGMMYGTILSPVLIANGYPPAAVVPAILVSQALGGLAGSVSHQWSRNANFLGATPDARVTALMVAPGLVVVAGGVALATVLPTFWVKSYIGVIVLLASILTLAPLTYRFAWWKHMALGALAAFNKALTGGGFGPVTSTGGIIAGLSPRRSVATTTAAEFFICGASFVGYLLADGRLDSTLTGALCAGALIGGIVGPWGARWLSHSTLRGGIGVLGIVSGVWLLVRVWG